MSSPLTAVTGATGFVGSHVLHSLVKTTDHRIRLIVRNVHKTDSIKQAYPDEVACGRIEFAQVTDMTEPGSFHDKLDGVDYFIHVASPLLTKNSSRDTIEPAVAMTRNLLLAADESSSLKRIVFTGSIASVGNWVWGGGMKRDYTYTEKDWNPFTWSWIANWYGPLSYLVSKTLAEKLVWRHVEEEQPNYDVVVLNPTMVFGPIIHSVKSAESLNETSLPVYKLLDAVTVPKDSMASFADVRDVGKLHVLAATEPKASNQRYLVSGGVSAWQSFIDYAHSSESPFDKVTRARLPVGYPGTNTLPVPLAKLDTSKIERDLGWTSWRSPNECLGDALLSVVELEKKWKE